MLKKTLLLLTSIVILSGCGGDSVQKKSHENSKDAISLLTQKIEECQDSGFIDYVKTEDLSEKKQEEIISSLRKTDVSADLEKYFCSQNRAWRAYTAENIHTSEELLWFYSHDEDEIVRQYLAANRKIPEAIAQKLKGDASSIVRVLARNPAVTKEVLLYIFQNSATLQVQESLCYNRGISDEFQQYLAGRITHVAALVLLAKNPEISDTTRVLLEKRDIEQVNKALKK